MSNLNKLKLYGDDSGYGHGNGYGDGYGDG